MAGKRSKSSDRWLRRQKKDYFARRAREEGQVSRAHFKLAEMHEKFNLITRASVVLELGAAPGGWTSYIEERLSNKGGLVVVDPLPITCGAHTIVIEGLAGEPDTDLAISEALAGFEGSVAGNRLGSRPVDLVLSDMAPNMSGVRSVDQARSMELADVSLAACRAFLRAGGAFAVKAFQGEGLDEWVIARRQAFKKVAMTKPKASRPESREVFVVCRGYMPAQDDTDGLV